LRMADSAGADAGAARQELPSSRKHPAAEEGSLPLQSFEAPAREPDTYRSNEEAIAREATLEAKAKKTNHQKPVLKEVAAAPDKPGSASYAAGAEASTHSEVSSVLWIDGLLLEDTGAGGRAANELENMDALRKDESIREAPKAGARRRVEKQKTMDHYRVMQRPLRELPLSQQTRQQYLGGKTVQTEVQRMKDGVQLILFTDFSLDTLRGGHAVVQQVGRDSLIVQINSHRIAYRLPEGWYDTNAHPD